MREKLAELILQGLDNEDANICTNLHKLADHLIANGLMFQPDNISFKAKRRDNGEELESDSILQFNRHPVTRHREASLWEEGTGWVPVDPDTLELIGGDAG